MIPALEARKLSSTPFEFQTHVGGMAMSFLSLYLADIDARDSVHQLLKVQEYVNVLVREAVRARMDNLGSARE